MSLARLTLERLDQNIETLYKYFTTAPDIIATLEERGEVQENIKGIAWIYKTGE